MKKNGFTMGEVALTVGIVGFLAAVFLPVIKNAMPNQEQLMFKKAYYLTERVVSELVNDEDLYPEKEDVTERYQYLGNEDAATYKGVSYSGSRKFAKLFAAKLNKSSGSCGDSGDCIITTSDGMIWTIPTGSLQTSDKGIYIDVNGNKKPNCNFSNKCKKPDQFYIFVSYDGRVYVTGPMEKEYLNKVNIGANSEAESSGAKMYD